MCDIYIERQWDGLKKTKERKKERKKRKSGWKLGVFFFEWESDRKCARVTMALKKDVPM